VQTGANSLQNRHLRHLLRPGKSWGEVNRIRSKPQLIEEEPAWGGVAMVKVCAIYTSTIGLS